MGRTAERRTVRVALAPGGAWRFPNTRAVRMDRRGRPPAADPQSCKSDGNGEGEDNDDNDAAQDLGRRAGVRGDNAHEGIRRECGELDEQFLDAQDDSVHDSMGRLASEGGLDRTYQQERAGGGDVGDVPQVPKRQRHEDAAGGAAKRSKESKAAQADDLMEVECPDPGALGLVTRIIPMSSAEAGTEAARAAVQKELKNITGKHVFDPNKVYDWAVVRTQDPAASVGTAKMILGRKNAELGDEVQVYKGRMVFQGNRVQSAGGSMVYGAPEDLYGKPVDLCLARTAMTVATLNDWVIEAGDIEGAYLNAPLRGPPIYMRMPAHLWDALGVPVEQRANHRDPCVRLERALYGLPRSGFDWFAEFDRILVEDLGWSRVPGHDSLYQKTDALLAVYVDDVVLAGTPHARRREWAAVSRALKLKEKPQRVDRFLGVKYVAADKSAHKRVLRASQADYVQSLVAKYDKVAHHPAGRRAAPAVKNKHEGDQPGERSGDCRSFVGALMYVSRATRPDVTFATNWLARNVSAWTMAHDKELEQLVGYLNATSELSLEAVVDVRDKRGGLWLEMWVDADHAGEPQRKSTTGWALLLKGRHGTRVLLDWASRKQNAVSRSSGEAETVALSEALERIAGTNRGLCATGLPVMDALEKLLGSSLDLRVFVDASVSKAAAEKGTSNHMKYISKTQGVNLFWLRDIVQRLDVSLEKVDTLSNVADLLTKPLCGARTVSLREELGVAQLA